MKFKTSLALSALLLCFCKGEGKNKLRDERRRDLSDVGGEEVGGGAGEGQGYLEGKRSRPHSLFEMIRYKDDQPSFGFPRGGERLSPQGDEECGLKRIHLSSLLPTRNLTSRRMNQCLGSIPLNLNGSDEGLVVGSPKGFLSRANGEPLASDGLGELLERLIGAGLKWADKSPKQTQGDEGGPVLEEGEEDDKEEREGGKGKRRGGDWLIEALFKKKRGGEVGESLGRGVRRGPDHLQGFFMEGMFKKLKPDLVVPQIPFDLSLLTKLLGNDEYDVNSYDNREPEGGGESLDEMLTRLLVGGESELAKSMKSHPPMAGSGPIIIPFGSQKSMLRHHKGGQVVAAYKHSERGEGGERKSLEEEIDKKSREDEEDKEEDSGEYHKRNHLSKEEAGEVGLQSSC